MAEKTYVLTRAGYDKLQRELNILVSEESEEVAQLLADVREDEQGEEAVFFDAMIEKERLDERISYLQRVLARAEIIESDSDPDVVSVGNRVTVYDMDEKEKLDFDLLSSEEIAYGRSGVSTESPVGKALLGHKVGDKVTVDVPAGEVRYKIREIGWIPDEDV